MIYIAFAVGACFCTYWVAQAVFVHLHLRWTRRPVPFDDRHPEPAVTVVHPVKDLDHELFQNLASWASQDYRAAVQHIFSFQDAGDAAIPVIRRWAGEHPALDVTIIVNPRQKGLNGKSSNMVSALKIARHEMALFVDSDIRVHRDFIRKMIGPLADPKVGVTTCGQIDIGGRQFWTRFFTFLQNCETDFNWAFLTRLGMDVGITGAAFAMRRAVIQEVGGLERFGGSLLEDMFLGNLLYEKGYAIVLGPFVECHVSELPREKSINYAKRLAIGIKTHIAVEAPLFVAMLGWHWALFVTALVLRHDALLVMSLGFLAFRTLQGLAQRLLTGNRILPIDLVMPLFFDLFGVFWLLYPQSEPTVTWRGITYRIREGGYIDEAGS
jgi:cellulose synthase/poly-beta-1,6-N-acetylglucosamine synthase-like glycosyltransferase